MTDLDDSDHNDDHGENNTETFSHMKTKEVQGTNHSNSVSL